MPENQRRLQEEIVHQVAHHQTTLNFFKVQIKLIRYKVLISQLQLGVSVDNVAFGQSPASCPPPPPPPCRCAKLSEPAAVSETVKSGFKCYSSSSSCAFLKMNDEIIPFIQTVQMSKKNRHCCSFC